VFPSCVLISAPWIDKCDKRPDILSTLWKTKTEREAWLETHIQRQVALHDCLHRFLGDGYAYVEIAYWADQSSQGRIEVSFTGMKSPTNQPGKVPFCALWVPIHLRFNSHSQQGPPLSGLSGQDPIKPFQKITLSLFTWLKKNYSQCIFFFDICLDAFCHLRFYLIHLYHISSFYQYNIWKIYLLSIHKYLLYVQCTWTFDALSYLSFCKDKKDYMQYLVQ
jgi:hypothetical protein